MLAASENYKGIKFVRISSLPVDQKNQIWKSIDQTTIIKILKGDTLMNDCVQYKDYLAWYQEIYPPIDGQKPILAPTELAIAS
ncbi:MAG TPA: hypothetical protein VL728_20230 [Cyclobacteriaceae bacterium]|jgi:hypothetical protein|nr:hypothetical protein [Cyclobacteriaceae bacterium]